MWTRESLEAAIAKRARTLPGLTPGTVYIGPLDPTQVAGKDAYVAITFGGGPFGRPVLSAAPQLHGFRVSAYCYASSRIGLFVIVDALVPLLGSLKGASVELGEEGVEDRVHFLEIGVGVANLR